MIALSIVLRQAISHELEIFNAQFEQEAIINSILAMKKCREYLTESEAITENLNSIFRVEEETSWWKKS